jgi:putative transcriptional regulator
MKNHVRALRKAMGLRQEDLARRLGVTRQTIIAVENGKYNPTLELAMKMARLLGRPVEELFILNDEKYPRPPDLAGENDTGERAHEKHGD